MAKPKFDFIIEAVHRENGQVAWVRGYRRRFVHYSDVEIVPRETLIRWLHQGRRIAIGRRRPLHGNEFDIHATVGLTWREGRPWLINETRPDGPRELEGVPEL